MVNAFLTDKEKIEYSYRMIRKLKDGIPSKGAASTIVSSNLTAYRGLISDANGKVAASNLIQMNPSGNGIAFGKVSESDSFEVDLPTFYKGNQQFVVDFGFNSDGYYRKWEDGTMECWGVEDYSVAIDISAGAVYGSPGLTKTFAQQFAYCYFATVYLKSSSAGGFWIWNGGFNEVKINFSLFRHVTSVTGTRKIGYYAIGRWK